MAVAADEIERLNRRVHALQSRSLLASGRRRDSLGQNPPAERADADPR
jgi:hypothetical protein